MQWSATTLSVLAVLMCSAGAPSVEPQPLRRIVVLYPESDGRPGNLRFGEALRSTLEASRSHFIEIHNEYLDATRFSDEGYQRQFAEFLRNKYQNLKLDVVVAGLFPSLEFLLKYREQCFPGVPVVYGAIELEELKKVRLREGCFGKPMRFDLSGTLEFALKLHPGTKQVYVCSGLTEYDRFWERRARQEFRKYEDRLTVFYLSGRSVADLEKEAATFPPESVVFYLHVLSDRYGATYTPAQFLEQLAPRIPFPIYGHVETYLGRGIVGGRVMSFQDEGTRVGKFVLTLLRGEKVADHTLESPAENAAVADWRQLRRWGLSETALPPGTLVLFKEPSLWDGYKWHIVGVGSLCLLEAALIVFLLLERAGRRKAEERFLQAVEAAPNGKVIVNSGGRIVLVNVATEKLFGFKRSELLGQKLESLLPARYQTQLAQRSTEDFAATFTSRMEGRELVGRRKDGTEFPIEIKLNPVRAEKGHHLLANVIDITERRRFESALRDINRELVTLTGRLLRAQETERRRIARELHDDLNQNLALVSVDLDLLAQQSSPLTPLLTDKLNTISDRVRQLSSSVHELSHHLHPAKVEQLGLVLSLRALCLELGKNHEVAIEYVEYDVAQKIPSEVSLCLYRIAQEALWNVIKHSRAGRATVELQSFDHGLTLAVSDDGVGFDSKVAPQRSGLGLLSMQERVRLVNGTLTIDSLPGRGTRLDVTIPLLEEATGARLPDLIEAVGGG